MNAENGLDYPRRSFLTLGLGGLGALATGCAIHGPKTLDKSLKIQPTGVPALPEDPTPIPTEIPPVPDLSSYFEQYIFPALYQEALDSRLKKESSDPNFRKRVDMELNEGRINFVLLGLGSEGKLTDSIQILSILKGDREARSVSIQRDTEAPEIARFKGNTKTYRINQAHAIGGMPLIERVMESATGLSADFVAVFSMDVLPHAVEKVFDNHLSVCIPWKIEDKMMGDFPKGRQDLTGEELLRATRARYYATNEKRNIVQQYALRAIMERVKYELTRGSLPAIGLLTRSYRFFMEERSLGTLQTNFDETLFIEVAENFIVQLAKGGEDRSLQGFGLPDITARYHIHAQQAGDENDRYRKQPVDGNPQAQDLITGYWHHARAEVRDFLTSQNPGGFEQEAEIC